MPKQFVFVAGHSATGKETFIKKVVSEEGVALRKEFRLHGSLGTYGSNFAPIEDAIKSNADTILIKWQFAQHDWIESIKNLVPSARHRVILLWKPYADHLSGLMNRQKANGKIEWSPTADRLEKDWYEKLVPRFRDIHLRGIDCELVHGRTHERLIDWP
jgi:hypothetical protein